MTAQATERVNLQPPATGSTRSSSQAYARRMRRQQVDPGRRLTTTGSPITAALTRVPFVAVIILLLAGGIVGVLWLNTMTDAAGLKASESRLDQMAVTTQIEAVSRDVAGLQDPARLAAAARAQGLVPPGDAAMLEIGTDGQGTVVGTPTPVPAAASAPSANGAVVTQAAAAPTPAAAAPPAAITAATAITAASAPARPSPTLGKTTTAKTTAPAKTAAPARTGLAKIAPATAARSTAARGTAAQPTAATNTALKRPAAPTTAIQTTAAKTRAAKSTATPTRTQRAAGTTGAGP